MVNEIEKGQVSLKIVANFFIVIATVFAFFYHYTLNDIFAYMGLLFMLIPIFLLNLRECIYSLFFYVPNIRMYAFVDGNTFIFFFVLVVFIKFYLYKKMPIYNRTVIPFVFMGLLVVLNSLLYNNIYLLTSLVRFFLSFLLMFLYLDQYFVNEKIKTEYMSISKYFIYGCINTLICSFLMENLAGEKTLYHLGNRFAGINNGPNFFAMVLGFSFTFKLVDIFYTNRVNFKEIGILFIILLGGMSSVSRGYLISILINLVLFVYILLSYKHISIGRKFFFFAMIVIIAILFKDVIINLFDSFYERFTNDTVINGNGRTEINQGYITMWKENFTTIVIGIGSANKIYQLGLMPQVHHNYYVELLTSIGLLGVFIMLSIYSILIKKIFASKFKFNIILFFPLITYGIMLLTLPALFGDTHLVIISLALMQYRTFQKVVLENKK